MQVQKTKVGQMSATPARMNLFVIKIIQSHIVIVLCQKWDEDNNGPKRVGYFQNIQALV